MATYDNIKKIKIGDNVFNLYDSGNSGGTITKVKTTAGAHTVIDVTSGAASFNVPTKTSHLTNDSNFVTGPGTNISGQLAQWNGTNTITSGPKVTISTSTPSGGTNGDIWFVYS